MNIEKLLKKGVQAQRQGQLDIALKTYRQVLKIAPSTAQAHTCVGSVLLAQGNSHGALASLRRAVDLAPRDAGAHNSLGAALTLTGALDEAERAFDRAVGLQPNHRSALCNLGDLHANRGNHTQAVHCYERVLQTDPQNARAANNLGNALLALGELDEARGWYTRALEIDPSYTIAKENLEALVLRDVPQWHFEMLADGARNDAYQAALERAVTAQSRVLDIGTGSGLLAMMAARAGAAQVDTCEMSPPIASSARRIIATNGYSDQIVLHNKASTQLVVGIDIPARANLIVSEILDNKLLGEGALPSLRHAREELLDVGGTMIPRAARLKAQFVEAQARRATHPLRQVSGFDLSEFETLRDPNHFISTRLADESLIPLSDVFTALSFDFADLPAATPDTAPHRTHFEIAAIATGTVQAVAFWFELDLDETTSVSSGADGELTHWRQNLYMFPHDLAVVAGGTIGIEVAQSDQMLRFGEPETY